MIGQAPIIGNQTSLDIVLEVYKHHKTKDRAEDALTQRFWTGLNGDGSVYTAGNWTPIGAPVAGDVLVQFLGTSSMVGGNLSGDPLFLGAAEQGTTIPVPAVLNLSDGATPSVVVGPNNGDPDANHFALVNVNGSDGINMISGPTNAANGTGIQLNSGASLTANIFLSGNNGLTISGDSTTSLANSQINVGNRTTAIISTHTLGTDNFVIGFLGNMYVQQTVDSGASFSMLANSGATLTLQNPGQFSGTLNFVNASAATGVSPIDVPSIIALAGVSADSFTYGAGVLTLYAGSTVTDTVKLNTVPGGGFAVYNTGTGVLVTSSNLTTPPADVVKLGFHT